MSRACFLSAGGDPFIALFAIKLWRERWYDEVDKFYICYNNHAQVPLHVAQEFITSAMEEPKVQIIYHNRGIGNGVPITEMTKIAQEDLVMLLEDDGWAWTPGKINSAFQKIEVDSCDAVGSARFSCGEEIAEAAKKKYNLDYSGYGDRGPWVWPNFFFVKRKDLLRTDLNFGSKSFVPGEYCKELDHTFKEVNHTDTFGWGAIQLRALGLRFHNIPQFHVSPTEIQDKEKQEMNWYQGQTPYWYHVGSLSAGWGGYLQNQIPDVSTEGAKMEIESRVAGWQFALDMTDGFKEFRIEYQNGIKNLTDKAELNPQRIKEKYDLYKNLMRV